MTEQGPGLQYKTLRWWLIPVIAAHNFEEWLTFPVYGETGQIIASHLGIPFQPLPWPVMQLALILVTIIPALVIIWASIGRQNRWKNGAIYFIAGIFFANVFLPHIPAAILAHGYSPGILTAVFVTFPFCLVLGWLVVRENVLPLRHVLFLSMSSAVLLIPSIIGVLALSKGLTGLF